MESAIFVSGFVMVALLLSAMTAAPAPGVPTDCENAAYCITPHNNATQDIIDNLLKQYKLSMGRPQEHYFGRDTIVEDNQDDCKKHVTFQMIYKIRVGGLMRDVVQSDIFRQQVRLEICETPGRLTRGSNTHFQDIDLSKNTIMCRQDMMAYNFLVLNQTRTGFESVRTEEIPVNCACHLDS